LWLCDADGTNPVKLSNNIAGSGAPRWSPDAKKITFDTAGTTPSAIYVVDITERVPWKLKTNVADVKMPEWSHDGKWIYFTSDEPLGHKIYRQPVEGGTAEELPTDGHSVRPAESADGAYLYFTSREVNFELEKILLANPMAGIQKEPMPRVLQWTLWKVVPGGVYFVPNDAKRTLRYFDLASGKVKDVFTLEKDIDDGISVSPDGRYILYSQLDEEHGEIMVMDRY
jgi:Tol biopolymer transport system component